MIIIGLFSFHALKWVEGFPLLKKVSSGSRPTDRNRPTTMRPALDPPVVDSNPDPLVLIGAKVEEEASAGVIN